MQSYNSQWATWWCLKTGIISGRLRPVNTISSSPKVSAILLNIDGGGEAVVAAASPTLLKMVVSTVPLSHWAEKRSRMSATWVRKASPQPHLSAHTICFTNNFVIIFSLHNFLKTLLRFFFYIHINCIIIILKKYIHMKTQFVPLNVWLQDNNWHYMKSYINNMKLQENTLGPRFNGFWIQQLKNSQRTNNQQWAFCLLLGRFVQCDTAFGNVKL